MTAGRGYIALAALILAKWKPVPVLLACLFFGFTEALSIQLQGVLKLPSGEDIPVQFIQIIPYVLTIIVLAGFIGLSRAPKASEFHIERKNNLTVDTDYMIKIFTLIAYMTYEKDRKRRSLSALNTIKK